RDAVEEFACGLAALRLEPRTSKVAVIAENRPEWAITYLACACTGIVLVPIDKELRETEVYHILYLSGADALVGDQRHIDMVRELRTKLPKLRALVNMDEAFESEKVLGFVQVRELGRSPERKVFADRVVSPDDLLSINFTSGTMGNSKGVMLTHCNVASNL